MRSIWSNLVLRVAGCRPPQSDSGVDTLTPRTFCINIRSIQYLPEVDQRHNFSNVDDEEPVSVSLVPQATRSLVGRAFLETWCDTHDFLRPKTDFVCIEFTVFGQTQRFESVHQIVDNEESILFSPNRPSAELSLLEDHIREYSNTFSKRDGKALPRKAVSACSRTWRSKIESLRRLSRASSSQCAEGRSQDKPPVRLDGPKNIVDIRRLLPDSNEVKVHRSEERVSLVPHASEDASGDVASAQIITTPIATLSHECPLRNKSAELQNAASRNDPCMGQDSKIEITGTDNQVCTAQEVSSLGTPSHKETEHPMERLGGGDGVTVRKDEVPSLAQAQYPADLPNALISPLRDGGDLYIPRTQYTNATTTIISQGVAESDNREQEPGHHNEMDTWDFCQTIDQASIRSSGSEGLPFPDDYWTYDENAKNYYHIEVGDDATETISWYPLEFD